MLTECESDEKIDYMECPTCGYRTGYIQWSRIIIDPLCRCRVRYWSEFRVRLKPLAHKDEV